MSTLSGYVLRSKLDPRAQKYAELMPKIDAYLKLKRVPEQSDDRNQITRSAFRKHFGRVMMMSDRPVDEVKLLEELRTYDPVMERKVVRL
jgi:hypothetical protein|eukprot:COSAG01_NODE_3936_length_5515_cov_5.199889_5_plen_90_part_00